MTRYLVVAYQTAESKELTAAIRQAAARDPDPSFVLLVPATPVRHLRGWTEGEARAVAEEAGEKARKTFERNGVKLDAVRVGDPDPVNAAVDEFNDHPDYDQVILSSFPHGESRWLKGNAYEKLKRRLPIPVTHVVSSLSR